MPVDRVASGPRSVIGEFAKSYVPKTHLIGCARVELQTDHARSRSIRCVLIIDNDGRRAVELFLSRARELGLIPAGPAVEFIE